MIVAFSQRKKWRGYKSTARPNLVSVMLTVQSYGCASRHDLGPLATISSGAFQLVGELVVTD
jgi:hypothetical protein